MDGVFFASNANRYKEVTTPCSEFHVFFIPVGLSFIYLLNMKGINFRIKIAYTVEQNSLTLLRFLNQNGSSTVLAIAIQ